jgi:hypothetical protein
VWTNENFAYRYEFRCVSFVWPPFFFPVHFILHVREAEQEKDCGCISLSFESAFPFSGFICSLSRSCLLLGPVFVRIWSFHSTCNFSKHSIGLASLLTFVFISPCPGSQSGCLLLLKNEKMIWRKWKESQQFASEEKEETDITLFSSLFSTLLRCFWEYRNRSLSRTGQPRSCCGCVWRSSHETAVWKITRTAGSNLCASILWSRIFSNSTSFVRSRS